ncbi:hypothetical protein [Cellulomonas triticagri]|uniref:DUF4352 domain-containing protein n=1 Tax=Cellulomonas triticagri TaxID=2483352 RepID=A0A3M2JM87_9CELL|nr:hypothetical protein [Cellulomonas triticagri]RMI14294.1 hypothetical protein EBM89_00595 [Cellulomonas triticagri]
MSTHPLPWRTRLRAAAVAAVPVVGVGASLATTPPPERCPDPPAEGEVSELYGQQTTKDSDTREVEPSAFTVGGSEVVDAYVRPVGCIDADATTAEIRLTLRAAPDDLTPIPEDVLSTFRVRDGRGGTWAPVDAHTNPGRAPDADGWGAYGASADVVFTLPVKIRPPVTLHLGDLAGTTPTEVLVWDTEDPTP